VPADSSLLNDQPVRASVRFLSSSVKNMPLDRDPLAYFITWTVYGTHLQGASTGWKKVGSGEQLPQPQLEQWRHERLNHPIVLLDADQRTAVETEVQRHSQHRGWKLWACQARSNHVHTVITASLVSGRVVRDQLKANCTRGLRERWTVFRDRPVWTQGGDWKCLNTDESLIRTVDYVLIAQDRRERDHLSPDENGRPETGR
jgi:hypothetical protein